MSEERGNMLHGVLLIALFSCAAFYIGDFPWVKSLSFSPMIVGIMLGMLYANSLRNRVAGYVGSRHSVLLEARFAAGYRSVRFPADFSGRAGRGRSGPADRCGRRDRHDLRRGPVGTAAEDGSGHCAAHVGR